MLRRHFLATPLAATLAGSAAPVLTVGAQTYPRLFYNEATIEDLKARLKRDNELAQRWSELIAYADRLSSASLMPQSDAEKGSGDDASFGAASRQIGEMGMVLGLAFHVTQNETYSGRLREALLHFSGYTVWHGPGFPKRNPPWHSELNTARFCLGFAAGYDALHDVLGAADGETIRGAFIAKGILPTFEDWLDPHTRIHALDSMGHNWWSVCVSNAGLAALALYGEEPRAPEWISAVSSGIAQWFEYRGQPLQNKTKTFDSKGAMYESVNYANYALSEYLRYRLAFSNVFPNEKQPDFAPLSKTPEYVCHTFYPSTAAPLTVNFGDSPSHLQLRSLMSLLAGTGYNTPSGEWYCSKTESRTPDIFELLIPKGPRSAALPALPTSMIYPDIGWATLRTGWKDDATMLAVKSGFTWNHAHADASSFILFHGGQQLIIDSGTCDYGRPEYTNYYVQSLAHNVVLFNGQGEPKSDHLRGCKFSGKLHGILDSEGIRYLYADATGPMAHFFIRNYRHWVWLGNAILIFDDIEALEEGTFDWLLHYGGEASIDSKTVSLRKGKAAASVQFLYPGELNISQRQGLAEHAPDTHIPYLAASTSTPARVQKFITAVVLDPQMKVEAIDAGDLALGVRVTENGVVSDFFFNLEADGRRMHVNSNNSIKGWETDAYLVGWTRPERRIEDPASATRLFLACGSYLRRNGRVYFSSLTKQNACWRV